MITSSPFVPVVPTTVATRPWHVVALVAICAVYMSSGPPAPSGLSAVEFELSDQVPKPTPWANVTQLKSPQSNPSPESLQFDVPVLIWRFALQVSPPSVLIEAKYWKVSLPPPELRVSYQVASTLPVLWSTAISGRNWVFAPPSSLIFTGVLHVAPSLSEWVIQTSKSSLSSTFSSL